MVALVGIVLAVVVIAFLFMMYGLPALRNTQNMDDGNEDSTTINVPDKIDVNVPDKINVDVEN